MGDAVSSGRAASTVDITYVVIGFNEAATLRASLESCRRADLRDLTHELIYVDAGSTDDSIAIAQAAKVDRVLGGDKRRRAAQNRNLGFEHARGTYVQFVDGDMTLAPDWPAAAAAFLTDHPECAAVCGNLVEANQSTLFRALQIDWAPREGYIRHCGGAALYRRDVLDRLGGFPEDVAYGEEPYLCWRIRNELQLRIYQLNRTMANHDLGFNGLRDYWRRNVRCGMTYAEIAARFARTNDPLWLRESIVHLAWLGACVVAALLLMVGPGPLRLLVCAAMAAVVLRKFVQTRHAGYAPGVAAAFAVHTYLSKVPVALGELKWLAGRMFARARGTRT